MSAAKSEVKGYANRICTSLPSFFENRLWKGVLKPRHFLGVRLAVMTMSWISSSDSLSMAVEKTPDLRGSRMRTRNGRLVGSIWN